LHAINDEIELMSLICYNAFKRNRRFCKLSGC